MQLYLSLCYGWDTHSKILSDAQERKDETVPFQKGSMVQRN